ncbi:ead/Ea22-like family protein [Klebsiella pneumoniae]
MVQRARINAECGEHLSPAETMELVEALESEKRICATWRKTAKSTGEKLEKAQTINAAAEKLVRCKGRYHSEQNYRALAALFGVNTPDLPPLEHENVHYADAAEMEIAALRQRIAELEREVIRLQSLKTVNAALQEAQSEFHRGYSCGHKDALLESRTLKLPEVRITIAEAKLRNLTPQQHDAYNAGASRAVAKICQELTAAGIKVEAE